MKAVNVSQCQSMSVNVSQCQSTSKFVKSKVSQSQQYPSPNEQNSALPRHRRTFCTRCNDCCPNCRCPKCTLWHPCNPNKTKKRRKVDGSLDCRECTHPLNFVKIDLGRQGKNTQTQQNTGEYHRSNKNVPHKSIPKKVDTKIPKQRGVPHTRTKHKHSHHYQHYQRKPLTGNARRAGRCFDRRGRSRLARRARRLTGIGGHFPRRTTVAFTLVGFVLFASGAI